MNNKSQGKFVCICSTPYYARIIAIKSLLDTNEIPYFIESENFAWITNFRVMVQEEYLKDTEELLRDFGYPETKN